MKSIFAFHLMSLEFLLRDLVLSPRKVLRETGMCSGMNILDFGCGPGSFSLAAARLVGPEGRVYALDIHPLAMRYVIRRSNRYRISNIYPILATKTVDLSGLSIDIALLYDVLHDITDSSYTLEEIHRAPKDEGLLSVRDHHLDEKDIMAKITERGLFHFHYRGKWTLQFHKIARGKE